MQTALLDGDVLIYRATYAASATHQFGNALVRRVDLDQGCEYVDLEIARIRAHFEVREVMVALSYGGPHWRQRVFPAYKGGRPDTKPDGYAQIREYVEGIYRTFSWPPLEADDVLGILSTWPAKRPVVYGKTIPLEERVVVSIDKDLKTIPGNYSRSFTGEVETIDEEAADLAFLRQVLTGDSTDGYPGCPGVGPVRAARILPGLTDPADDWFKVLRAYEKAAKKGGRSLEDARDDAVANARCARILRHGEYDLTTQEPKLWEPPV